MVQVYSGRSSADLNRFFLSFIQQIHVLILGLALSLAGLLLTIRGLISYYQLKLERELRKRSKEED
ncbi:MAG: hypothetical protein QW366_04535 [Sulfolobales archaeon]